MIRPKTSYGSNFSFGFSPKLQRDVDCYSDLELDNLILIETNPLIKSFIEQKEEQWVIDGKLIKLSFDVANIWIDDTVTYEEVKYSSTLNVKSKSYDPRSLRQIEHQKLWCLEHNVKHVVRTELDIRSNQMYLSNMKIVLGYLRQHGNPQDIYNIQVKQLLTNQPVRLPYLISHCNMPSYAVKEAICWLYVQGIILANFDISPFGIESEVWLNE